eukprot:gene8657-17862_t
MWKTLLQKAAKEVRFVVKQAPEHYGTWRFLETELAEIRMLSPRVFVSVDEISQDYKTQSTIHIIYGDDAYTMDDIPTEGLSCDDVVKVMKEKVVYGLSLARAVPKDNESRNVPIDIVEAHNKRLGGFVHYLHNFNSGHLNELVVLNFLELPYLCDLEHNGSPLT